MNASSTRLATWILVFCFAFAACSSSVENTKTATDNSKPLTNSTVTSNSAPYAAAGEAYPQSVVDEFLKSCVAAGSNAKFCACVLDKVQKKYSLEEFSVIESEINAGTPPEDFVEFTGKARAECMK